MNKTSALTRRKCEGSHLSSRLARSSEHSSLDAGQVHELRGSSLKKGESSPTNRQDSHEMSELY